MTVISSFGKMLLGGAAAYGAISLGKDALERAAEREKQRVNFEVMTGNRETGNNLLQKIIHMADVTPFESQDLIGNAKMLMQYGLGVDKVMPTLQKLGDISGADKQKLESLTMAFGKVTSEGKLNGRSLEEMIYAGYNPLNDISKKTGLSMALLRKEMERGAISAKMVERAFDSATGPGGRFYNLMERQAQTLSGRYSTLMDNWHHKVTDLGESMMPLAGSVMQLGTNLLEMMNVGKSHSQNLQSEKYEVNSLVESITRLNQGDSTRGLLLDRLRTKYPDLLSSIKTETVTNNELLSTLQKINIEYNKKIGYAANEEYLNKKKSHLNTSLETAANSQMYMDALNRGGTKELRKVLPWSSNGYWLSYVTPKNIMKGYAQTQLSWANQDVKEDEGDVTKLQKQVNRDQISERMNRYANLYSNPDKLKELIKDTKKRSEFKKIFGEGLNSRTGFYQLNNERAERLQSLIDGSNTQSEGSGELTDLKGVSERGMSSQKEINIHIQKLGIDKFELHSVNVKEGISELERMMKEMMLRIVYSANGMAVN